MDDKLWMEAWEEMKGEIVDGDISSLSVSEYLEELGPMPDEALLLGKCDDELPVLLNLRDPIPKSLLLVSDFETEFLRSVAFTASLFPSDKMSFGVITPRPSTWGGFKNCVGVFSAYHSSAGDFILSAASWAHGNKSFRRQSVLLLLDGMDEWYSSMEVDTINNFRWLLLRGSSRNVWVIATSKEDYDMFATKFFAASPTRFVFKEGDGICRADILRAE